MSGDAQKQMPPTGAPPVSAFTGPIGELIAQRMISPPTRPGLLAVLDKYEILRVLGGGGMGIVLLARNSENGRDAAVKLVKSDLVANQQAVHRFLKEAGHLKRLRHPHIVRVDEISDRAEGPYFVMPYYERGSLENRIKPGESLDTETILDIAVQLADGLSFAHRSGIIHRDLKPANVLLGADGQACLGDFGLARTLFNDTIVDVESRQLEGTAPYMSPAVAAGDAEDTRCDIYSFGALLYELLTGHAPYQGRTTKEILAQIIAGPPKPITSLNPDADRSLVAVAEGCMARELRDRYADMRDVQKDLQQIKAGRPPQGSRKSGRDWRLSVGLPSALVIIAVALAAFFLGKRDESKQLQRTGQTLPTPAPNTNQISPTPAPTPNQTSTAPQPSPPPAPKPASTPPREPSYRLSTLAGQIGTKGSADGSGNVAQFHSPYDLAVDNLGNVFVADTGNNDIRKITPDGTVSTPFGIAGNHGDANGKGRAARFLAPFGIAADSSGNLYVADSGNNTIRKITPNGDVSTFAGISGRPGNADGNSSTAQFRNPWSLAVDKSGNVFVADMSNDTIRKVTPNGTVSTFAGLAMFSGNVDGVGERAQFNLPSGVAVDDAGNVYVSDSGNETIRKIGPDRKVVTLAGAAGQAGKGDGNGADARFDHPQGLAVDGEGNLFVADTGNGVIRKISPTGAVSTLPVSPGNNALAPFNSPGGVALDKTGNIYVADTANQSIRKIEVLPNAQP